jgi:hypothetical protein
VRTFNVAVEARMAEERELKEIREAKAKAKVKAPVKCHPAVNRAWLEHPKN